MTPKIPLPMSVTPLADRVSAALGDRYRLEMRVEF